MVIEHLRPIFYVILLFSIIIMLTVIIKKKSVHNQIITFKLPHSQYLQLSYRELHYFNPV
ncbi:hypothetical protein NST89_12690 [Caldifermentibacillus hisashii]|uniref:hypothetical protein n=1 Tax=Caldifermentibacillus hisashii TaxID=996558 RepID=UPI0031358BAD